MKKQLTKILAAVLIGAMLAGFSACSKQPPETSSLTATENDSSAEASSTQESASSQPEETVSGAVTESVAPARPDTVEQGTTVHLQSIEQLGKELSNEENVNYFSGQSVCNGRWLAYPIFVVPQTNTEGNQPQDQFLIVCDTQTNESKSVFEILKATPMDICLRITQDHLFWVVYEDKTMQLISYELSTSKMSKMGIAVDLNKEDVGDFRCAGNRIFWQTWTTDGKNSRYMVACPEDGSSQVVQVDEAAAKYYSPEMMIKSHYLCWEERTAHSTNLIVVDANTMKKQVFPADGDTIIAYRSQWQIYGDIMIMPKKSKDKPQFTVVDLKTGKTKQEIQLSSYSMTSVLCQERYFVYCDGKQLFMYDLESGRDTVFAAMPNINALACQLLPCGDNFAVDNRETNRKIVVFSLKDRSRKDYPIDSESLDQQLGDGFLYYMGNRLVDRGFEYHLVKLEP